MRALVIGGSGFIGSHIVDALLSRGVAVRVYDRSGERFRKAPRGIEFRQGYFGEDSALAAALMDIDIVFHCLSTSVPSNSNSDPVSDIKENLIGTVKMLDLMRSAGVRRVVFLSSGGTIYGIPKAQVVNEESLERPITSYGIVKSAIEKYMLMDQFLHGLSPLILRASNPYGPRQGHGGVQGVVGNFLWRLANSETLSVWGDGSVIRDFIYVKDLAEACVLGGLSQLTGVFNVGSGEGASVQEIIDHISAVTGEKIRVDYNPGRKFDVPRIVLDISAIRQRLDWRPTTPLKTGIKKTWQWIIEQC